MRPGRSRPAPRWLAALVPAVILACARGSDSDAQTVSAREAGRGAAPQVAPPGGLVERLRAAPRESSPHWPHARFHISDFRISYQDEAVQRGEFAWTAAHFDRVILDFGDKGSVPHYRRLNPAARIFRYALEWTMIQPGELNREYPATAYYADMRAWYAKHPQYTLEDAFLHDANICPRPAAPTEGCRVAPRIWNQKRWAMNPGDAGLRAYHKDRLRGLASDADGIFLDEHGAWDMEDALMKKWRLREYPEWGAYRRDVTALLAEIRGALAPTRQLLINTAKSVEPWDLEMARAAGGTEAEHANAVGSPRMEERWTFIERALAAGALVELVSDLRMPDGFTRGSSATPEDRRNLFQLASYYLVVPSPPDLLGFGPGTKFDQPFERLWFPAAEVNVGRPLGARRVLAEGRARDGKPYRVWARDFEHALVVVRPAVGDDEAFGDAGAVGVSLPAGEPLFPLDAGARLGPSADRLALRPGEGAVLVRAAPRGDQPRGDQP
ncbi:MAG TPA: putative glycoside hydrolase [Gemmatimonadaceae bacterium]|nr:putative glycoside hydrolase [Gemmatimonadaceae bacterium]